jgi:predicted aspartyl protease
MNERGVNGMSRFSVELELANYEDVVRARTGTLAPDQVRRARLPAVVDSGSNYLVLPAPVVVELGLRQTGEAAVPYADRRTSTRPVVEEVQVTLAGRTGLYRALVEPDRTTALLGAVVLEDLDLLVDCTNQRLLPRDPKGIVADVE